MKSPMFNLVRPASSKLCRISFPRHLLSTDDTKMVVSAFVLSRLDYRKSLLSDCPQYLLNCKQFKTTQLALS